MATRKRKPESSEQIKSPSETKTPAEQISLSAELSKKASFTRFRLWIIGDTPLITHAWSEKARRAMLAKQVKATKPGKDPRDPDGDFVSSLYEMGEEKIGKTTVPFYGFPAMAIKNAILSSAHKEKGVARTAVMSALWLDAQLVRTRPALAGAVCDMPLLRIYGSAPEKREDMVRVGTGLTKTATLAYRAQFTVWGLRVTGRFNASVLTSEALAFLIQEAGTGVGIGEWRNERKGMFGAFHMSTPEEEQAWDEYADRHGPLPVPVGYELAAE